MAMTWVVGFTYDIDPDVDTLIAWGEQLDHMDASVAAVPGNGVSVTVWVDNAPDLFAAQALAHKAAFSVIGAEPVAVEAMTDAAYEAMADAPTLPEMVSAPVVGDLLGVSRQRVHQLQGTAGFPEPLLRLRTGPVWDARAIDAFARSWDRRPGRRRAS